MSLLTPSEPIPEPLRRPARALTFIALVCIIGLTLLLAGRIALGIPPTRTFVVPSLLMAFTVIYVLLRLSYIRPAVYLLATFFSVLTFVILVANVLEARLSLALASLNTFFSILIVSAFLPLLQLRFVLAVNIGLLLTGTFFFEDLAAPEIILAIIFISMGGVIATTMTQTTRRELDSLRQRVNRFSEIINASPEVITVRLQGRIVHINAAGASMLGYERPEELVGCPSEKVIVKRQPSFTERLQHPADPNTIIIRYREEYRHRDGTSFLADVTATTIAYDGELASLVSARPVPRLETRASDLPPALIAEVQTLSLALKDLPIGVVMLDQKLDTVVFVNPAMRTLIEQPELPIENMRWETFRNSLIPEYVREDVRRSMVGHQPYTQTYLHEVRGAACHMVMTMTPIASHSDRITHFMFTFGPELLAIEEKLALAETPLQTAIAALSTEYSYAFAVADDEQLTLLEISGAFTAITGYGTNELLSMGNLIPVIHPEDKYFYEHRITQLLDGQAVTIEFRVVTVDGEIHWVRDTATPHRNPETQKITHLVGVGHDITERVQAEEALKTHVIQQAVVAELGLLALNEDDKLDLTQHTLVLCEQVLGAGRCQLILLDSLRPASPVDAAPDLLSYITQTTTPVVVPDLADERRFTVPADWAGYASLAAVLVLGQEEPYATLLVLMSERREFSDDDVYFLQSCANVLGTHMERRRALEEERRQRAFADALRNATLTLNQKLSLEVVLQRLINLILPIVPRAEAAIILLVEQEPSRLQLSFSYNLEDMAATAFKENVELIRASGIVRHILSRGESVLLDDTRTHDEWVYISEMSWVLSFLGVPILLEKHVLGMLFLYSRQVNAFNPADSDRVRAFADHASIAIQNARNAEELENAVLLRTDQLKNERAQLQAILDATGEGILYLEKWRIRFANEAFSQMTGYPLADLIGQEAVPLLVVVEQQEGVDAVIERINQRAYGGEVLRGELHLRRRDGTIFPAGITLSSEGIDDPTLQRLVVVIRDISAAKALDEQRSRFIANAAHELRSPITNLNTRAYLMRRRPDVIFTEHLPLLENTINRVNRLVSDLLDLSYFEHGRITLQRQTLILQEVIQLVAPQFGAEAEMKGQTLSLILPDSPVHMLGDPHRLEQVFMNLLANAITYTPVGGQITLEMSLLPEKVRITVRDTGRGIAPEDLPNIFIPFYRAARDQKGTGLGLSIVREIVDGHLGEISVESEVDQGTAFTIILPRLVDEAD